MSRPDDSACDDAVLAAAVRERGDPRAFAQLYERHTPALYGLALRQLAGDAMLAEDVVHDAWVRSMERLGSFRGDSALRTWLSGFVVRIAWEACRRRAAEWEPVDGDVACDDDTRLTGTYARIDLERALATLPPGFRQVVVLHDIEGFTHEEIAAMLGIVPGTSKSQLSRARAALRSALTNTPGENRGTG